MKKTIISLVITVISVLAIQSAAFAVSFVDFYDVDIAKMVNGSIFTHTFNLNTDTLLSGDINAEDIINSARLYVDINDDCDSGRQESIKVKVDGIVELNREVNTATYTANILAQVYGDHTATVWVKCTQGDFYLDWLKICGDYTDISIPSTSNPVPEPATMLLLGSGLVGLFASKKRKA